MNSSDARSSPPPPVGAEDEEDDEVAPAPAPTGLARRRIGSKAAISPARYAEVSSVIAEMAGSFSYAFVSCESNGLMFDVLRMFASSRYFRHAIVRLPLPASSYALKADTNSTRAASQSRSRMWIFPPHSWITPVMAG